MSTATDPALESATWDLEPLVDGRGADGVEALLTEARDRAAAFAERYRGRLGELDAPQLDAPFRELS
jgi:oligoendopeptidase F